MTAENEMQIEIDNIKSQIDSMTSESEKILKNLAELKKELSIKIRAKSMFLGIKTPKKIKKKKVEENHEKKVN